MAKLVKSVQSETSEAIAGMEESIAEVVEGSKLASQAGEALADIDAVSVATPDQQRRWLHEGGDETPLVASKRYLRRSSTFFATVAEPSSRQD